MRNFRTAAALVAALMASTSAPAYAAGINQTPLTYQGPGSTFLQAGVNHAVGLDSVSHNACLLGASATCQMPVTGGGAGSSTITAPLGAGAKAAAVSVGLSNEDVAAQALISANIGAPGATVCATDTGSCALNAQIQRLLQRVTTLLSVLPSALDGSGHFASSTYDGNTGLAVNYATGTFGAPAGGVQSIQGGYSNAASGLAPTSNNLGVLSYGLLWNGSSFDFAPGSAASGAKVQGTVTANAGTNLNTSALALDTSVNGLLLSQGSTTSGQKGTLHQGAVTTSAPSYTTGQTAPLSLNAAGGLRTDNSSITPLAASGVSTVTGTITSATQSSSFPLSAGRSAYLTLSNTGVGNCQLEGQFDGSNFGKFVVGAAGTTTQLYTTSSSATSGVQVIEFGVSQASVNVRLNCASTVTGGGWVSGTITYSFTQ